MYIIGTSGHIDHGKTTLIKKLTGTDTDRLPEEKATGMTIDIGFASIDYPSFGTVSIIDVPGHERYIRNMVTGAWGIDLGMLVIAVDDGWMPQTEDHFRVLLLMGIERIIIVLNKIDLADDELKEIVTQEVRQRLRGTIHEKADIVGVSAKNGTGLEELKETLAENLKKLQKAPDNEKPYLFVDRVFTVKGHGTVVTGTLKNGFFEENDQVTILPGKIETRIKSIQSHYEEKSRGNPSQRTALNLAGISPDQLSRGHIIFRDTFFSSSSEIVTKVTIVDTSFKLKNNQGIELLIGTTLLRGKALVHKEMKKDDGSFICRFKLEEEWFVYPGEPFIIALPGGFNVVAGGKVVFPDRSLIVNKKMIPALTDFTHDLQGLVEAQLFVRKYIDLPSLTSLFPLKNEKIEKSVKKLIGEKKCAMAGDLVIAQNYRDEAEEKISQAVRNNTGLNIKEIADISSVPLKVVEELVDEIIEREGFFKKETLYFSMEGTGEEDLPDEMKDVLTDVLEKRGQGIELKNLPEAKKKQVSDLIRMGLLVSIDRNIVYHRDVYDEMTSRIMNLFEQQDKITLPEAKDALNLTRKYLIPFLNRMETDGMIKRVGDFRIKA